MKIKGLTIERSHQSSKRDLMIARLLCGETDYTHENSKGFQSMRREYFYNTSAFHVKNKRYLQVRLNFKL